MSECLLGPAYIRLEKIQSAAAHNYEGKTSHEDQDLIVSTLNNDPCDVVRHEAAFLLGQMKKENALADSFEAQSALIAAATFAVSLLVRHEAALSLAKFKSPEAFNCLMELLKHSAPEVSGSARYALEEMALTEK